MSEVSFKETIAFEILVCNIFFIDIPSVSRKWGYRNKIQPPNLVIQERSKTCRSGHWPIQNDVDWKAHQACFIVLRSCFHDTVDDENHFLP